MLINENVLARMQQAAAAAEEGDDFADLITLPGVPIIGVGERCGQPPIAIHRYEDVCAALIAQGMPEEDVDEWIHHNILGAWVGERTPMIMFPFELDFNGHDA